MIPLLYRVAMGVILNNNKGEQVMPDVDMKWVWSVLVMVLVVMVGLWIFRMVKKEIPT